MNECFSKAENEKKIIWEEAEICLPPPFYSYDQLCLWYCFTSILGLYIFLKTFFPSFFNKYLKAFYVSGARLRKLQFLSTGNSHGLKLGGGQRSRQLQWSYRCYDRDGWLVAGVPGLGTQFTLGWLWWHFIFQKRWYFSWMNMNLPTNTHTVEVRETGVQIWQLRKQQLVQKVKNVPKNG